MRLWWTVSLRGNPTALYEHDGEYRWLTLMRDGVAMTDVDGKLQRISCRSRLEAEELLDQLYPGYRTPRAVMSKLVQSALEVVDEYILAMFPEAPQADHLDDPDDNGSDPAVDQLRR